MGGEAHQLLIERVANDAQPGLAGSLRIGIERHGQLRADQLHGVVNHITPEDRPFATCLRKHRKISGRMSKCGLQPHAVTDLPMYGDVRFDQLGATGLVHREYRIAEGAYMVVFDLLLPEVLEVAARKQVPGVGDVGTHLPFSSRVFQPT